MRYIGQRLVQLVGVLLVVTFLTFLLVRFLPGDPVLSVTGCPETAREDPICADKIERATADLGLDESIPVAYVHWLGDLLPPDVDLGFSYVRNTDVSELFSTAIPRTATLMAYSIIVSLLIAVPLGVLAAYRQSTWTDRFISTGAFGTIAIPNFVLGVLLIYVFAITLDWLPGSGVVSLSEGGLTDHLKSYTLPVLALALPQAAVFTRLLRTDMVSTLSEDFIGMAKAKGMPVRRILLRHALRPSSFTLLTVVGINIGQLIGGSVIIEFIWNINGMGSQLATAVARSDYVVVQAGVVIVASVFVIANFAVDFLYGVLDPRVRHARAH
jgi:peptide/nickel transport system permease protein